MIVGLGAHVNKLSLTSVNVCSFRIHAVKSKFMGKRKQRTLWKYYRSKFIQSKRRFEKYKTRH